MCFYVLGGSNGPVHKILILNTYGSSGGSDKSVQICSLIRACSTVGSEPDCRFRGCEFDPGLFPDFH